MEQLLMDKWQNQVFMVVCKNCGYVGFPQRMKPGNATIEFILWCCAGIPGVVYSLWRSSSAHNGCAVCQSRDVIFADSPIGKELVAKLPASSSPPSPDSSSSSTQYILNQRAQLMQQKMEEQQQKAEDQKRRKAGDAKLWRWIIYFLVAAFILGSIVAGGR